MNKTAMQAAIAVRNESDMKQKLGAAVVRGGNIIGLASNRMGCMNGAGWSRHAEVRATLGVSTRGADIYVSRIHGKTGEPINARPCDRCTQWLVSAGIKRVFYTDNGKWEMMKLT